MSVSFPKKYKHHPGIVYWRDGPFEDYGKAPPGAARPSAATW